MIRLIQVIFCLSFVVISTQALAQDNKGFQTAEEQEIKFNYQMFCQGCHVADGVGYKSVPTLKNFMGNFMLTQQGREYLVRVPGSAYSVLNDKDLAKLLNWMLYEFSDPHKDKNWRPYNEQEVSIYRKNPLFETTETRKMVIKNLPIQ